MIVLVTGVPGSGKTLYTVSKLLQESFKDRTVYVNNIKNLLLPHEVLSGEGDPPPVDSDVFHWFDGRVPNASVIVIDEAQRVFRPRSATSAVPSHVAKLETHRHMGLDFVLITQHPQLIDVNVRRLVGRHLDVRRMFGFGGGALVYEWDHCQLDTRNVRNASKRPFKYRKEDFALYKSAEVHTKPTNKVPTVVKVFGLLLLLMPLLVSFAMKRFGKSELPAEGDVADVLVSEVVPTGFAASSRDDKVPLSPSEYVATFEPRVPGIQHTAQRYDEVTKPQRAPLPVSCIKMEKKGCKCYTQDATPYQTTQELCEQIVDGGIFLDFLPENQPSSELAKQEVRPVELAQSVSAGQAIVIPHTPSPVAARKAVTGAVGASSGD